MTIAGLVVLKLIDGVITAVDLPLRQSFVIEMIEKKEDIGNAIALNSSAFNGARIIGPAVAVVSVLAWLYAEHGTDPAVVDVRYGVLPVIVAQATLLTVPLLGLVIR